MLLTDNVSWGLDESIWDLYGILGQPASVLIDRGVIVDQWYGALGEAELREKLSTLISG